MADYSPDIDRVECEHNGLPIFLKLRTRNDVPAEPPDGPPVPYYTLSWRTIWPSGININRRLYRTSTDGYWTLPVLVALKMLEESERRGMLGEEYDDLQTRHGGPDNASYDSRVLTDVRWSDEFTLITTDDERANWGESPVFYILEVPDRIWRKIVIVDSLQEFCTFRSTTTDTRYGMKESQGMPDPWLMDRSMQDASAAMMRQFLQVLRGL